MPSLIWPRTSVTSNQSQCRSVWLARSTALRMAGSIPSDHRDPFDRMLAAQAIVERLTVISPDPAFAALGAACPLPVFALGGVGPADLATARAHGAFGVAGIRAFGPTPTL